MTSETSLPWQGELQIVRDFVIFHGRVGDNREHAHYSHQAVLSTQGDVELEIDGKRRRGTRLVVASTVPHRIAYAPAPCWVVHAEPLAISAQQLTAAVNSVETASNAALIAAIETAAQARRLDPRIAAALVQIEELLDGKVRGAALARRVNLSLSQLQRLMSAQLGLSLRRLVLWRRLCRAIRLTSSGSKLTDAAYAAGFADAAHFSRTVRSMFGVRADRILTTSRTVVR